MNQVLVIAPHPDDETLGCGGTILRHRDQGDQVHWLIMTQMDPSSPRRSARKIEIDQVSKAYGFASTHQSEFMTTRLDTYPLGELVDQIGKVISEVGPSTVYVPYPGDVHSDHRLVFAASASCMKWFRYASISRFLAYETLSETDLSVDPEARGFKPTSFVDISKYLDKKIEIMSTYQGEMGIFPFPRSPEAIRGLATVRGAASGYTAAEAFILLKERW